MGRSRLSRWRSIAFPLLLSAAGCGRSTSPAASPPAVVASAVPTKNGVPLTAEQLRERDAFIQRAQAKKQARARGAEADRQKQAQLRAFQAQMKDWQWRRSRGENVPPPFPMTPVSQRPSAEDATVSAPRSNPFTASPELQASIAPSSATAPFVGGIGFTRSYLERFFSQPELGGFSFEYARPANGLLRTMGKLASEEASVELIGPTGNIQSVSIMVGLPNDDDGIVLRNFTRMHALLGLVLPGWSERQGWLNANVPIIARNGQPIETRVGPHRVSLVGGAPLPILVLTVED